MAKDPAFLYYDADASKDVAHMNRLERGAYLDIIHAQKKFGKLSLPVIKKVLGADFDSVWVAIEMVLTKEDDVFFIEWVGESIEKRKNFAKKQKEKIDKYYEKKANDEGKSYHGRTTVEPRLNHGNTVVLPYVNENENENENEIVKEKEKGVQGGKQNSPKNAEPLAIGFFDISECHQNYFDNSALERTREHLCMTHHVSVEILRDWGDAFNRRLTEQGELIKTFKDYNTHFGNWLKLQDKTKNPKTLFRDEPDTGTAKNKSGANPSAQSAYDKFSRMDKPTGR